MQRHVVSASVTLVNRYREIRDLGRDAVHRDRGLTTTEIAVLTFVLVATAVAIGALLYSYANDRVDALPDTPTIEADLDAGTGGGINTN